jgi:DNA (cytosine-5)-methyltransferase 1
MHGDFTTIVGDEYEPIDLLVGGTPCQSFSIAGLRGGLDDDRGNLALEFLRLAQRTRPKWLVWENVPGVLSSNGGRDFGSIIGGMVEIGYGIAYRVLDAQYFGVAQRRRRVFVVGCLGNAASAAAVLFERHSLQGHFAPSREKGQEVAGTLESRASGGGGGPGAGTDGAAAGYLQPVTAHRMLSMGEYQQDEVASAMKARDYKDATDLVSQAYSIMPMNSGKDYKARETEVAQPLMAGGPVGGNQGGDYVAQSAVRRLTPRECERLQGFSDDFTQIPYRNKPADQCPDGPRYKALGNSMAVPVMRWIGTRINIVEQITGDNNGR